MRSWLFGVWLVAATAALTGCGPNVSREELGEVVFELPKVPPTAPSESEPASKEDARETADNASQTANP